MVTLITQIEIDKDLYSLLSDGGWVSQGFYKRWFHDDDIKQRRLASAMEREEVSFRFSMGIDKPKPRNEVIAVWSKHEKFLDNRQGRIELLDYWLGAHDSRIWVEIDANSLLKWLKKNYPLEDAAPAPPNSLPFMNDKLTFAVECSKTLYPDGYKPTGESTKVQADRESGRIRDYLKKHDISARAREALIVQLNPVKK